MGAKNSAAQAIGADIVDIRKRVEARVKEEEEKYGTGGGSCGDDEIDSEFIRNCLNAGELGDAELFKRLQRDKFVYNKSMDGWMVWTGHHWEVDKLDRALAVVEDVVLEYQKEIMRINEEIHALDSQAADSEANRLKSIRKALNKKILGLRCSNKRRSCVTFAHTTDDSLSIVGNEVDKKPWLLACKNGVVDLRSGELRDGRPEDYLLKACPVEWQGVDAPCPLFEKALLEILSDNESLYNFFQRLVGFSLVGDVLQSIIAVLTGQGRNGKSLLVNVFSMILGQLAGPVRSEMLLDQARNNSSSGPTPDIMALRGRRLCFASETDDGCKISPSRVKWLTGNDQLTGRNPHDKYEVEFKPTHTLFLLTNHKPHAPADDFAFWERVILIPFDLSFVNRKPVADNEREADPELLSKLKEELPGIFAWMVKGCLYWQNTGGLKPPAIVKEATADYRRDEDALGDFFEECTQPNPEAITGATALYTCFEQWWEKNISKKIPKQRWFGKQAQKRYHREKKSGTYKYFGVELIADQGQPGT